MNHFRTYCVAHSSNATYFLSFPNIVFKKYKQSQCSRNDAWLGKTKFISSNYIMESYCVCVYLKLLENTYSDLLPSEDFY